MIFGCIDSAQISFLFIFLLLNFFCLSSISLILNKCCCNMLVGCRRSCQINKSNKSKKTLRELITLVSMWEVCRTLLPSSLLSSSPPLLSPSHSRHATPSPLSSHSPKGKKMSWASDFYGKAKKSKNRVLFLCAYFNQVESLKFILSGKAYLLRFLVVFGGLWWSLVVFGGFWWFLVVFGGFWWLSIAFAGFWWLLVVFW